MTTAESTAVEGAAEELLPHPMMMTGNAVAHLEGEDATAIPRTRRDKAVERTEAVTSEIVALKDADRVVKAAAKAKARARSGSALRPVRASKSAVRKTASRGPARGTTRR